MALYRLHKAEWEQQIRQATEAWRAKAIQSKSEGLSEPPTSSEMVKRKLADDDEEGEPANQLDGEKEERKRKKTEIHPGGGRKGVSSGLGVIVRRNGLRTADNGGRRTNGGDSEDTPTGKWWEEPAG